LNNPTRSATNGTQAARGAGTQTQARTSPPENSATSHNVPRPPSAGGSSYNSASAAQSHNNVPRPPASNDAFARPNSNTAASRGSMTANNEHYGAGNAAANSASRVGGSQYSASRAGSASVPRPPANYQYHAAPSYSASSSYGRPSTGNYGYGSSRSYSSPYGSNGSRSYGSNPGYSARSYGSSPNYSARSYGSTPNYSARSYGSSPSHSARSYSAPRYSGGSSYHGGGSSYHGGGGSHGGGGGHGGGGHR